MYAVQAERYPEVVMRISDTSPDLSGSTRGDRIDDRTRRAVRHAALDSGDALTSGCRRETAAPSRAEEHSSAQQVQCVAAGDARDRRRQHCGQDLAGR
jgi:hypothetical protein